MKVPTQVFFDDIAVADSWKRLVDSFLTAWRQSDDFFQKTWPHFDKNLTIVG